jgi:hypothetical protein
MLGALAATQLGASECDGSVIEDSGFDLWCGDQLCAWDRVRGDTRRVATWHAGDSGVELVGDDAAIAQRSAIASRTDTCIAFELVANVEPTAEAYLEIDVFGDGSVERRERLPTARWRPLSYNLLVRGPYTGIEFVLSKRGSGVAQLARIEAAVAIGCEGLTPIDGGPGPR